MSLLGSRAKRFRRCFLVDTSLQPWNTTWQCISVSLPHLSVRFGHLRLPMPMHQMSLFFGSQSGPHSKTYLQEMKTRLGYLRRSCNMSRRFTILAGSSFSLMMCTLQPLPWIHVCIIYWSLSQLTLTGSNQCRVSALRFSYETSHRVTYSSNSTSECLKPPNSNIQSQSHHSAPSCLSEG